MRCKFTEHCVDCPGEKKKENVNKTTVFQEISSVNVTRLSLDEPIGIGVKISLPAQPDSHVSPEQCQLNLAAEILAFQSLMFHLFFKELNRIL